MYKLLLGIIARPVKALLAKMSADKLKTVAVAVGMASVSVDADGIWAYVEGNFNKVVTLLTTIGKPAEPYLQMLLDAGEISKQHRETVEAALNLIRYQPNSTSSDLPMGDYADEFAIINNAIRADGSLDRLLAVRAFMRLPDEVMEEYMKFKVMARSFR